MPEVKRLVRRFSRKTIMGCMLKLNANEKLQKRIRALRREARQLARKA